MKNALFPILLPLVLIACKQADDNESKEPATTAATACPPNSKLNTATIEQLTGMKGTATNGDYKINIPQNDLKMMVDGFKITPPMGLNSWVAFSPCGDSATVTGELVLTEIDLKWLQQEVINQGFAITALHNHFVRNRPAILHMHIGSAGDINTLSNSVKSIFNRLKDMRGKDPASDKADTVANTLNIELLNETLGQKGEMNNGVYTYTFERSTVQLRQHGKPISSLLGFHSRASWQGARDRAAVSGEIAALENEVAAVVKALTVNGLEVTAVHNNLTQETPRTFAIHFWGSGNATQMATGLKRALDETH